MHRYFPYSRLIILILTFYLLVFEIKSQERGKIFSRYFSIVDYKASEQNWDLGQDKNGIMYFGNQDGMLQYDGTHWEKFLLPNRSAVRSLEIAESGHILVGGFDELGYFAPDNYGKLKYFSLLGEIEPRYKSFGDVWNVEIVGDSWYYQTDQYIFQFRGRKCKVWENFGEYIYYNYLYNNILYFQVIGKGIYSIQEDKMKILPKSEFFSDKKILVILPYKNLMLIGTKNNGIYLYNPEKGIEIRSISTISEKAKELNTFLIQNGIYAGLKIEGDRLIFSTVSSGSIVVDGDFNIIDVINKETTNCANSAYNSYYDMDGNLWLALDNGILKVELATPFRYWDAETGLLGSTSIIKQFNNSIYVATGRGVFGLEKGYPSNKFGINRFHSVLGFDDQVWQLMILDPKMLMKAKKNEYTGKKIIGKFKIREKCLIAAANEGLFVINKDKPFHIFNYEHLYFTYPSKKDSSKIFLGLTTGLARISYNDGVWYDDGKMPGYQDYTSNIAEDEFGNLWLSGGYKGVYKVDANYINSWNITNLTNFSTSITRYDTTSGLPTNETVLLKQVGNKLKFYTYRGCFVFNYKTERFEKDLGMGSNYVDSSWKNELYIDNNNRFWIDAREINRKGSRYYADTLTIKRLKDYKIGDYTRDTSNRIWLGSSENVFCNNKMYEKNYFREFPAIIRKVVLNNDSVIYNGINFRLKTGLNDDEFEINYSNQLDFKSDISYSNNEISFNFACPQYEANSENEFRCFLEGYDKLWSAWNQEVKKAYTNLPAGKYKFKVKARNIYGIESTEASFSFNIKPPWYLTLVAVFAYLILLIGLVWLIVKLYARSLIKQNEKLEEVVKMRTSELFTQKEEIHVQAESLKEANENITTKNNELEIQKTELVKRTKQLETSDATRNKFFRIIAHDLRNPISSFVSLTSFMMDDFDGFEIDRAKKVINELNKISQNTFNLLENLLEWSSDQMGEIKNQPKKINITSLINSNLELIDLKAKEKQITIKKDLPEILEVFADINMLNTVVRNLLSNAVKFTYEDGKIDVSGQVENNKCYISIKDNGIGLSGHQIKNLFSLEGNFSNPGTRNEKGSGIGLILCNEFILKMGGTLQIESNPSLGSNFTFSLPLE